ncbi:MAG: hypothetical protein M3Y34_06050 [Actinomycetota bacterium]|nr:hypothetical protein [Actinomycetota bacterium]
MDEQQSEATPDVEEPKSDREDGGPTSDPDGDGEETGAAHGTKESEFEPHE